MRIRVHETVKRLSVRPSVCPIDRQQQRREAGLLLSAPAGRRYRSAAAGAGPAATAPQHGVQQQMWAVSCWQARDEANVNTNININNYSIITNKVISNAFSALTLLVGRQKEHPACIN